MAKRDAFRLGSNDAVTKSLLMARKVTISRTSPAANSPGSPSTKAVTGAFWARRKVRVSAAVFAESTPLAKRKVRVTRAAVRVRAVARKVNWRAAAAPAARSLTRLNPMSSWSVTAE